MKTKLRLALTVLAVSLSGLALAATPTAAPAKAFVSDKTRDYFGYFLPVDPITVGKFQLKDFFIGGKDDFKSFEGGKADKAFAAVMIEFEDITSPKKTAEDGQ